jgi:hypothetical protein
LIHIQLTLISCKLLLLNSLRRHKSWRSMDGLPLCHSRPALRIKALVQVAGCLRIRIVCVHRGITSPVGWSLFIVGCRVGTSLRLVHGWMRRGSHPLLLLEAHFASYALGLLLVLRSAEVARLRSLVDRLSLCFCLGS